MGFVVTPMAVTVMRAALLRYRGTPSLWAGVSRARELLEHERHTRWRAKGIATGLCFGRGSCRRALYAVLDANI